MKNKVLQTLKSYLLLTVGAALLTVGVYFFKIPNGFATGGVSGIGTILGALIPQISSATWIAGINVLLLIVGFLFLGKNTGVRTVYCSLLFSGFTWVLEWLFPLTGPMTDQPLLELVYAMLLTAIGSAVMFHEAASSGGTDIIALILKKYTALNVGAALLCVDFVIAASTVFIFGIETGLFSLMGLFAKAFLVDSVIESMDACKYFMIITTKPDEISEFILKELHHGATSAEAEGAYTHEGKTILHTVCRRSEAVRLQRLVKRVDPHAFMIITTSSEIVGRGFRGV